MVGEEVLDHRFTYHPPKPGKVNVFVDIRETALNFAKLIDEQVPDGREKALALTKLEEVVMWSNAGIARSL